MVGGRKMLHGHLPSKAGMAGVRQPPPLAPMEGKRSSRRHGVIGRSASGRRLEAWERGLWLSGTELPSRLFEI